MTEPRNETIVLDIIRRGPTHGRAIAKETKFNILSVNALLGRLSAQRLIVRIGSADQVGIKGARGNPGIWAVWGTEPFRAEQATKRDNPRIAGRIEIGRGFNWAAGY